MLLVVVSPGTWSVTLPSVRFSTKTKLCPSIRQGCDRRHYWLFYIHVFKINIICIIFTFRHYPFFFFFKSMKIMSLFVSIFSKTYGNFRKFLCEILFFLQERLAHKALGLLLTAQSAFDRERWAHKAPLNTVLACFNSVWYCFSVLPQHWRLFCRKTLKYDTLLQKSRSRVNSIQK